MPPGGGADPPLLAVSGVNSLSQSLSANPLTASTLSHLDLSGNALRGDDLSVGPPSLRLPSSRPCTRPGASSLRAARGRGRPRGGGPTRSHVFT